MKNRYTFYTYPHEADFKKRIRLSSIGDFILNAAGMAASEKGFGMNDMHAKGIAWVVSRLAIKMTQYPKEYESFDIETWIEDCGRIASTRQFRIYDQNNNQIGEASSLWSIIDLKTRKAVDLRTETNFSDLIEHETISLDKPKRIEATESEYNVIGEHTIKYSDIDINRHTNSMKYLQWVLDSYKLEHYKEKEIARCDINYLHETLEGNSVSIIKRGSEKDRESDIFELYDENKRLCCKICLEWD